MCVHVCKYVCILYRATSSLHTHHGFRCEAELLTHKNFFLIFYPGFVCLFRTSLTREATDCQESQFLRVNSTVLHTTCQLFPADARRTKATETFLASRGEEETSSCSAVLCL